jgi:hypothetical protein
MREPANEGEVCITNDGSLFWDLTKTVITTAMTQPDDRSSAYQKAPARGGIL